MPKLTDCQKPSPEQLLTEIAELKKTSEGLQQENLALLDQIKALEKEKEKLELHERGLLDHLRTSKLYGQIVGDYVHACEYWLAPLGDSFIFRHHAKTLPDMSQNISRRTKSV